MNFFKLKFNNYYYKKSKKKNNISFSDNTYWMNFEKFRDPDGKIRNLAKEYEKKKIDLKNEIEFLKKKFGKKNIRILDLGSGFGFFLKALPNTWDKNGIELSNLASRNSRKWSNIYNYDLEKIFSKKQLHKLKKFDVIFSYHVVEHLKKPEIFLFNVQNLLKKKGFFVLGTPNFDSGCARLFKNKYRFFKDPTHITYFSENSMFRMLDTFGFKIFHVDYPYFRTSHFSIQNLKKLFKINEQKVSPPFYGNIMTFYCQKKTKKNFMIEINYKKKIFKKLNIK